MHHTGGPFEFTPDILMSSIVSEANVQLGLSNDKVFWTRSGRSGISLVLQSFHARLSEGWMLLPDYQCWDIISVFADIQTKYIPVNNKLQIEIFDLEQFLLDDNLKGILLVDYFGLSNIQPYIDCIKSLRPDILIIIDAVQAFLSIVLSENKYSGADIVITSPRKFLPIPDGGLVIANTDTSISFKANKSNIKINEQIALYIAAGVLRNLKVKNNLHETTNALTESLYLEFFDRHRKLFTNKIEPISSLSMEIIKRSDLLDIAKKKGPIKSLVVIGVSAWTEGQLEGEIDKGHWNLSEITQDILFQEKNEKKHIIATDNSFVRL